MMRAIALTVLMVGSPAFAEPGACHVAVMVDGARDRDRPASGDLRFSSLDGGWFGDVLMWGEGEAGGAWNGAFGGDHAQNVMGPLV